MNAKYEEARQARRYRLMLDWIFLILFLGLLLEQMCKAGLF